MTGSFIIQSRYGRSWIWSDYAEIFDFRCLTCNEDARVRADTAHLKKESIVCEGCRCACLCSSQCFVDRYADQVMEIYGMLRRFGRTDRGNKVSGLAINCASQ